MFEMMDAYSLGRQSHHSTCSHNSALLRGLLEKHPFTEHSVRDVRKLSSDCVGINGCVDWC